MEVYSPPIARESRKRDFRNIWNAIRGKDPTDKHQHLGDKKICIKAGLGEFFKREPSKRNRLWHYFATRSISNWSTTTKTKETILLLSCI